MTETKRKRPALMQDVAELAGVSAMTVSRVLNTPEKVRSTTRARVMAAMQELGYRPNPAARVLAAGRSGALGVVGLDTRFHGHACLVGGIELAAHERGQDVSVTGLGAPNGRSISQDVGRLCSRLVDGIIIVAAHEPAVQELSGLPSDLPIVVVGAAGDPPFPLVATDQETGAVRATRHLLSLGHQTVWHLSGPPGWIDARTRVTGWRRALQAGGHPVPEHLVGDWSARSGYELGSRIARDPAVTAVFAANDAMALGSMRALREANRRVPEDVSVVGFDDVAESAFFAPALTTVRQDFSEVGRRAFELLMERLDGIQTSARSVLDPELIVRESTAPRRRAAPRQPHMSRSSTPTLES